ncbi:MAG: hypothetical protein V1792_18720 [Pseudomonadota bacterium]
MKRSCRRHPDREGVYFCQKDMMYMCEECACCHSPRIYCQYRTACMIDLLTKEGGLQGCAEKTHRSEASGAGEADASRTP